jgi:osmotically-inducible protein OsmY
MRKFSLGAIVGAIAAFVLDPKGGRRRRTAMRDRAQGLARRVPRTAKRSGGAVSARLYGMRQQVAHLKEAEKPQPDDVTLARKVETEIFRDDAVPKGKIDVNAENGVVFLRGVAERPEMIEDLEAQVSKIPGVQGVQNLLHLPGEPAPSAPAGGHNS